MKRYPWWKGSIVLLAVMIPAMPAWGARGDLTAIVTVLHALPGFTADVYVNGELTLSGFEPETATDPLELPPGEYTLEIRDVGASPDSEPALEGAVRLKAGQNLSIIAGLTEDGAPALNVFANDITRVPPGRSRLVVRNVAQAPSFGVQLDGDMVFRKVLNAGEATRELRAGVYSFETTLAGEPASGPEELVLEEGTAGIVYAVGTAEEGTLEFMFQTIRGLHVSPDTVLTGDGGLASTPGFPAWAEAAMVLAGIGLAGSIVVLVRRRASSDRLGFS